MRELNNTEVVVFCLDDQSTRGQFQFTKCIDIASAVSDLTFPCVQTIGMYKGELEAGYMMSVTDYTKHSIGTRFSLKQESVLVVNSDSSAYLATPNLSMLESLGRMVQVESPQGEAWTYVTTTKRYFTTC